MSNTPKQMKKDNPSKRGNPLIRWVKNNRWNFLALFLCAVLFFCFYFYAQSGKEDISATEGHSSYSEYELATVLSVTEDTTEPSEIFEGKYTGNQSLMVKIN